MSKAALIDDLIQSLGLLNPHLKAADRSAGIQAVCDQVQAAHGKCSVSTVYNHLERLRNGLPTRKPRSDKGACRALPEEVQHAARQLFVSKRWCNTPTKIIQRELQVKFPAVELSYDSLQRYRDAVTAELSRYGRAFRRIEVGAPNEVWAIDCSPADFFCVAPGHDKPLRVQLTVCEDACTRSIMYARYSLRTGFEEIGQVLYQSILRQSDQWPQCGVPDHLLLDWGKVFVSDNLSRALDNMDVKRLLSHPYYPQDKGKCERVIGSVHRMAEALLPGYCGSDNKGEFNISPDKDFRREAPGVWFDKRYAHNDPAGRILTLDEANAYLWAWITGPYHQEHRVRTLNMTPLQAWAMHAITPRMYSESFLELNFLSRKYPTVRRGRLACNAVEYLHPCLMAYNGLKLEVRYDPSDIRAVHCYFRGERVCTATVDNPLFTAEPRDLRQLEETRRHNRAVARQRRELLDQWQHDDLQLDPAARVHQQALAAQAYLGPDAEAEPDPVPGLSKAEAEALDGLYLNDIPLSAAH